MRYDLLQLPPELAVDPFALLPGDHPIVFS